MNQQMKRDALDFFGVQPTSRDDTLILGFDNGAGNCCAVLTERIGGGSQARRLYFDANGSVTNLYTVLAHIGGEDLVGQEWLRTQNPDKTVYVSFKRPPGTDAAREAYGGDLEQPSYEALMRRFFQCALGEVFHHNRGYLADSGKKHAVVFVGRPASQVWQEHELDYQRLLGKGLCMDGCSVDLVIYSEAQAALAYEYSQGKIGPSEYILIVDCGSSTFDAVLVHGRSIVAEYSRQLGAGEIEMLMLDAMLADGAEDALDHVDARLAMRADRSAHLTGAGSWADHVAMLRGKKEDYFGTKGDNGDPDLAYSVQMLKPGGSRKILRALDAEFMARVLNGIPIRVADSYTGVADAAYGCTEYPSFSAAVQAFLEQTRQICADKGCPADQIRVVLTGGASVMPFISDQVRAVFGANAFGRDAGGQARTRSENPAFSVGEGLAFMGTVELQKREVLKDLRELVRREFENKQSDLRYQVSQSIINAAWQVIDREFTAWAEPQPGDIAMQMQSIINMPSSFYQPQTLDAVVKKLEWSDEANRQVRTDLQTLLAKRQWGEDSHQTLIDQLAGEIQKQFVALFPGIRKSKYRFKIPKELIADALADMRRLTVSQLTYTNLFGIFNLFFGAGWEAPLDPDKRKNYAATVHNREQSIRRALHKHLRKGDGADDLRAATQTIIDTLTDAMGRKIEDYIEQVTPYFVERYTAEG